MVSPARVRKRHRAPEASGQKGHLHRERRRGSPSGKAETKPGGHSRTGPNGRGDVGKWREGPAVETDRKEDKPG